MHQRVLTSAFVHRNGKVLLLKRGPGFLADHWEMPGGKVDLGEDPNTGVLRELKEEAGVQGTVLCPYFIWHATTQYKGEDTQFIEIDFIVTIAPDAKINPSHGMTAHMWVAEDELEKYVISPEMKTAILKGFEWQKG